MSVENISKKLEIVFTQMKNLSTGDYEKVIFNIELMKKKKFLSRFRKSDRKLFEGSFKEYLLK